MRLWLHPDPFLREKATYIPRLLSKQTDRIAAEMLTLMQEMGGSGLACPQVGYGWRMFVSKFGTFIDPYVIWFEGEVEMEEGCLSIPGRFEMVTRPEKIVLSAYNLRGRPVNLDLNGIKARIAQHEIDHLNGKLFIDYA